MIVRNVIELYLSLISSLSPKQFQAPVPSFSRSSVFPPHPVSCPVVFIAIWVEIWHNIPVKFVEALKVSITRSSVGGTLNKVDEEISASGMRDELSRVDSAVDNNPRKIFGWIAKTKAFHRAVFIRSSDFFLSQDKAVFQIGEAHREPVEPFVKLSAGSEFILQEMKLLKRTVSDHWSNIDRSLANKAQSVHLAPQLRI